MILVGLLFCSLSGADEAKPADTPVKIQDLKKEGKMPKPVRQGPPTYPYEMSRKGIRGAVVVSFIIDTNGNVPMAEVIQTTNPGFNEAALEAVKKWKFKAGEMNGRKVDTLVSQRIEFNLEVVR
jgi:protein TonB